MIFNRVFLLILDEFLNLVEFFFIESRFFTIEKWQKIIKQIKRYWKKYLQFHGSLIHSQWFGYLLAVFKFCFFNHLPFFSFLIIWNYYLKIIRSIDPIWNDLHLWIVRDFRCDDDNDGNDWWMNVNRYEWEWMRVSQGEWGWISSELGENEWK